MNKNDEVLSKKLTKVLKGEMGASAMDINVSSNNGMIQLSGVVDVLVEKNTAELIVSRVKDVKKVENGISICTDGTVRDKDIQQYVTGKLRDSEYSEELITVTPKVSKGNAILEGSVRTQQLRRIAIKEATKAFGVKNVVSHLQLSSHATDTSIVNELNRLLSMQFIDTNDLAIAIHNGAVYLNGLVQNQKTMENIVSIAESVPGVRYVANNLREKPKAIQ